MLESPIAPTTESIPAGEALLAAPATRPDATRPHDTADGLQPPDPGSFR